MNGFGKGNQYNKRKKKVDAKHSIEQITNKAINLHLKGEILQATKYYQYCLKLGVNDHRVFCNYGAILKDNGQFKEAELLTRKAIRLNPRFVNAYFNLGSILINLGKFKEAEKYTRKAIEINPNEPNFHQKLGIILTELDKHKEAEISLRNAIKLNPNDPILHQSLAIILIQIEKPREAEISLFKSIELKPNLARNYYLLATFNLLFKNKLILDKLFSENILYNQKESDLIDIYFARANILEKRCNYLQASEYLKKANNLNLKIYGSDYLDFKSKMKSYYINSNEKKITSNKTINYSIPIFIVGMPRSGKTITESILACNNRTIQCGEEEALDSAVKKYFEKKNSTKEKDLFKLYIDNLHKDIKKDSIICSTTPLNLIYTGLIISQIKNAKIIFCYRNPLDNIIKIYQKHLGSKHTYSCSVIESAYMWLETYLLMEKYKQTNQSKIYFLKYENLINEQQKEIKSLINWLGWEYNDKYLTPRIDPSTLSDSVYLNKDEISIWENYPDLLSPAIKIIENNIKFKSLI